MTDVVIPPSALAEARKRRAGLSVRTTGSTAGREPAERQTLQRETQNRAVELAAERERARAAADLQQVEEEAYRETAKRLEEQQRAQEKAEAERGKEELRQRNDALEAQYRRTKRPMYVDAHGAIQAQHSDEEWQAMNEAQAAKAKVNDEREALYRREKRPFYADTAGVIQPVQDDETWQAMQVEARAKEEAKLRDEANKDLRAKEKMRIDDRQGVVAENDDTIERAVQETKLKADTVKVRNRRVIDAYKKRLKDIEDGKLSVNNVEGTVRSLEETITRAQREIDDAEDEARAHEASKLAFDREQDRLKSKLREEERSVPMMESEGADFGKGMKEQGNVSGGGQDGRGDSRPRPAGSLQSSVSLPLGSQDAGISGFQNQNQSRLQVGAPSHEVMGVLPQGGTEESRPKVKKAPEAVAGLRDGVLNAWGESLAKDATLDDAQRRAAIEDVAARKDAAGYEVLKKGKYEAAEPEVLKGALELDAATFAKRQADYQVRMQALNAEHGKFAEVMTSLEQRNAQRLSGAHRAGDLVTLVDGDGMEKPMFRDLAEQYLDVQARARKWQDENQSQADVLDVERGELERDQRLMQHGVQVLEKKAAAKNDAAKAEWTKQRAQTYAALDSLPGGKDLGKRLKAVDDAVAQHEGGDDVSLQEWAKAKKEEIAAEAEGVKKKLGPAVEEAYAAAAQKMPAGVDLNAEFDRDPMGLESQASEAGVEKLLTKLGMARTPENRVQAVKLLRDAALMDWSRGDTSAPVRTDSAGRVLVNPERWADDKAYAAAVAGAAASAEEKAKALEIQPELKAQVIKTKLDTLRTTGVFNEWEQAEVEPTREEKMVAQANGQAVPRMAHAGLSDEEKLKLFEQEHSGVFSTGAWKVRWNQALLGAVQGVLGLGQSATGLAAPFSDRALDLNRRLSKDNAAVAVSSQALPTGNWVNQGVSMLVSSAPALAVGGAVGAVTRSEMLALHGAAAGAGLQTFGQVYGDAVQGYEKNKGIDTKEARKAALIPALAAGVSTYALTAAGGVNGMESILRQEGFKQGLKQWLATVGKGAFKEGVLEEAPDQLIQGVIARHNYDPTKSWGSIWEETMVAAIGGALMGGGFEMMSAGGASQNGKGMKEQGNGEAGGGQDLQNVGISELPASGPPKGGTTLPGGPSKPEARATGAAEMSARAMEEARAEEERLRQSPEGRKMLLEQLAAKRGDVRTSMRGTAEDRVEMPKDGAARMAGMETAADAEVTMFGSSGSSKASDKALPKEQIEHIRAKARVVMKIAQGSEASDLTDEELREVGLNRDGTRGHYEMVPVDKKNANGPKVRTWMKGEGQIQPVLMEDGKLIISQRQIDNFKRRLPAVAALVGKSEVERRQELKAPMAGSSMLDAGLPEAGNRTDTTDRTDKPETKRDDERGRTDREAEAVGGKDAAGQGARVAAGAGDETARGGEAGGGVEEVALAAAALPEPAAAEPRSEPGTTIPGPGGQSRLQVGAPSPEGRALTVQEEERVQQVAFELGKRGLDDAEAERVAGEIVAEMGIVGDNYTVQMIDAGFEPAMRKRGWRQAPQSKTMRWEKMPEGVGRKVVPESGKGMKEQENGGSEPGGQNQSRQNVGAPSNEGRSRSAGRKPLIEREDWHQAKGRVLKREMERIKKRRDAVVENPALGSAKKSEAQKAADQEMRELVARMNALEQMIDTRYGALFDEVLLEQGEAGGGMYAKPLVADKDGRATQVALVVDLEKFMDSGALTASGIERMLNEELSHRVDLMVSSKKEAVDLAKAVHAARPGVFNAAWKQYFAVDIDRGEMPKLPPKDLTDDEAYMLYFEATRIIHQGALTTENSELPDVSLLRKVYLYLQRWLKTVRAEMRRLPQEIREEWQLRIDRAEALMRRLEQRQLAREKSELEDVEPPKMNGRKEAQKTGKKGGQSDNQRGRQSEEDDIESALASAADEEMKVQRTSKQRSPFEQADRLMNKVPGPKVGQDNVVSRILNMGGITRPSEAWLKRKAEEGNSRRTIGDWDWLDASAMNWWEKRLFPKGSGTSIDQELQRMWAEGYFPEAGTPGEVTGEMLHAKIKDTLAAYERLKRGEAVTAEDQAEARAAQLEEEALGDENNEPVGLSDEEREALSDLDELMLAENRGEVEPGTFDARLAEIKTDGGGYSGGFLNHLDERYYVGSGRKRVLRSAPKRQPGLFGEDFEMFAGDRGNRGLFEQGKAQESRSGQDSQDSGISGLPDFKIARYWIDADGNVRQAKKVFGIEGGTGISKLSWKRKPSHAVLFTGPRAKAEQWIQEQGGKLLPSEEASASDFSLATQTAEELKAEAERKKVREAIAERQEKPLVGSVGDIGQRDMLGGNDLFSLGAGAKRASGPLLFGADDMNFLGDKNTLGLFEQKNIGGFANPTKSTTLNQDAPATAGSLEFDRPRNDTGDAGGTRGVQPARGEAGDNASGVGGQGEAGTDADVGDRTPAGGAAADAGSEGAEPVQGEASRVPGGTAGNPDRPGSSGVDEPRAAVESGAELDLFGTAPERPARDEVAAEREVTPRERQLEQVKVQNDPKEWDRFKVADAESIAKSVPMLLPQQQEDVLKAERRFFVQEPTADDPRKGVMFTNGTGTGKTFTGLGIIKRFEMMGKDRVLIVVPNQQKVTDWKNEGERVMVKATPLKDTNDIGEGVVVTTYANMRENWRLQAEPWDLVVYDESHNLSSNAQGTEGANIAAHELVTAKTGWNEMKKWTMAEIGPPPPWDDEKAVKRYENEAEQAWKRIQYRRDVAPETRAVFLSATPFAYHKNLKYADGFLYRSPEHSGSSGYNVPQGFDRYLVENFGYSMRTNRLTSPAPEVDVGLMEREWAERQFQNGAMSGRMIDVPYDYSREFILLDSQTGKMLDDGFSSLMGWGSEMTREQRDHYSDLSSAFYDYWYRNSSGYTRRMQFLESIKVADALERMNEHLDMGRKIVLFHSYNNAEPVHPFQLNYLDLDAETKALAQEWKKDHPAWVQMDFKRLENPRSLVANAFGGRVRFFNGEEKGKDRAEAIKAFNDDQSGVDIIMVQMDAGKEGISLHDVSGTGKQRVLMNAALPVKPTDAIQTEGRIYRIGVKSNAIQEYLVLHTQMERGAFGSKISTRTGTVENMALGKMARTLTDSFKSGYLNAHSEAPSAEQGLGGKKQDAAELLGSDMDRAKSYYFGRMKKTSRNKAAEGADYFATPEPVGLTMVRFLGAKAGMDLLEPSAGHGAIGRFFPDFTANKFVEPSRVLADELRIKVASGKVEMMPFEDLHPVNKFDGVAMNPPFGTAGKLAMEHVAKAAKHLRQGGRLVAIIPEGPAMQKRFEQWLENEGRDMHLRASYGLPTVTFERAGTSVKTRIVVLDKADLWTIRREDSGVYAGYDSFGEKRTGYRGDERSVREMAEWQADFIGWNNQVAIENRSPRELSAETINELFDDLERLEPPARITKNVATGEVSAEPVAEMKEPEAMPERPPVALVNFLQGGLEAVLPVSKPAGPAAPAIVPAAVPQLSKPLYETDQTLHAKRGTMTYVAEFTRRIGDGDFNAERNRAKKAGGYWSSFKGNGAIPGFQFDSAEKRDAFVKGYQTPTLGSGKKRKPILETIEKVQEWYQAENKGEVLDQLPADLREKIEADPRWQWLQENDPSDEFADWYPEPYRAASELYARMANQEEVLSKAEDKAMDAAHDKLLVWEMKGGPWNHVVATYEPEIEARMKSTIAEIEATGRWEWDKKEEAFLPTDEDRTEVLYSGRKRSPVDAAAHEAATSPLNDLTPPTKAQQDEGNYKMGHPVIGGHAISIENPAGSRRRAEWPVLKDHYGYFKGTNAKDGDHVDVFVKPGTAEDYAGPVHVVRQVKVERGDARTGGGQDGQDSRISGLGTGGQNQNQTGLGKSRSLGLKATKQFDEYKVMLGYPTAEEAREGYLRNYEPGWPGMERMTTHSSAEFARIKDQVFTVKPKEVPGVRESDAVLASGAKRGVVSKVARDLPVAVASGIVKGATWAVEKAGLQKPLAALGSNKVDRFIAEKVMNPVVWDRVKTAEVAVKVWLGKPGAFNGIGKAIVDQTVPLYNVPREWLGHYHEAQRKAAWGREKAMDVIRALSHEAKVSDLAYPQAFVEDPVHRVRLFDAMEGKAKMEDQPPEMQAVAARLRVLLSETGREMVKQGLMNLDTFNELTETGWMPRFTEDEAEATGGSWLKAFKLGVKDLKQQRSTAWHIVDTSRKDATGQYPTVSREEGGKRNRWRFRNAQHRNAFYEDFVRREAVRFLQDGGADVTNLMAALDQGAQKSLRGEIRGLTREAVDLPGTMSADLRNIVDRAVELQRLRYKKEQPFEPDKLIKDPVYAVARYVMAQTHNAATMEMLKATAKNKEWVSDVGLDGFTEIPDNPRFGPLAKKWLRQDIATQVLEHVGVDGAAMQFYDSLLRKWKAGKLVLNPGSHVRDAVGNTVFAYLGGNSIWNPGNLPYYRDAIGALRDGGDVYAELIEQQVLGGDAFTTQVQAGLKGLLPDTKTVEKMDAGMVAKLFHGFGAGVRGGYDYLSELRKLPDDFYKTAAYLKYKSQGMTKEQAAAEVRKWFPYYDRLGSSGAWKQGSRFLMPFSSFFRESTRILGRAAMERPLALATSLSFAAMVTRYSLMMLQLGQDDEEAIKRSLRGKLKFAETPMFSMLLPMRSSEGQLQQWDISAVMPFADLLGSKVETREGEDTWTRFFRGLFTASPITSAAWSWSTNTDAFSGRRLVQEDMGFWESSGERLKDLLGDLLPPLTPGVGVHANTIATAGRRTGSLEMRNKWQNYLRAVVGLDVRSADPNLYTETRHFREKMGLPLNNDGNTYSTPLKSRLSKDIKGELIQDAPDFGKIAEALARLEANGTPVKSPKQMGDLLDSLDPARLIKKEYRQKLVASFSPEARRVYDTGKKEFQKAQGRVGTALAEARKRKAAGG